MMLVEVDMESLHTDALLSAVGFTSVWVLIPAAARTFFRSGLVPDWGKRLIPGKGGFNVPLRCNGCNAALLPCCLVIMRASVGKAQVGCRA